MLDQSQRQTILTLREAGRGIRAIARALGISRVAVKHVLASGDARPPPIERSEKAEAHRDDILALYADCKGNLVRVHEELVARGIVMLSYPALTAFCRKHGIGHEPKKPAGRYPFEPGKEMQHDTSPHDVHIGGAVRRVQTASLVLCYSHRLFFQFYPRFCRHRPGWGPLPPDHRGPGDHPAGALRQGLAGQSRGANGAERSELALDGTCEPWHARVEHRPERVRPRRGTWARGCEVERQWAQAKNRPHATGWVPGSR